MENEKAQDYVAPLVGAWIEIVFYGIGLYRRSVAPLMGAWIEIDLIFALYIVFPVAPFAGAWIEIFDFFKYCARAVVRVRWNSEDAWGHIFIAEQVNGKTIFVDMQSGEINVEHYFDDVIHGETSFMRVDNLDVTAHIKDCCMKVER